MIGGEAVRLTQGDYDRRTSYYKDPLDVALKYEECGVKRLHLVDLDGAKASRPVNLPVLERIASRTSLDIQYGGGIKSAEALEEVFNAGAKRAICGSVAVKSPELFSAWLERFGGKKLILGADVRGGKISINGWKEDSDMDIDTLICLFAGKGLSQVICTDISKDGMLQGPSFEMYTALQETYQAIDITVSGGISSMADIERLDALGLRSVIVGKAIYEGRITFNELKNYINA